MDFRKLSTTSVGLAVTPTVVSTLFSHYLNREPLRQRPTAHLSYDQGLHLVRSFLDFASHHTVEELQAFTGQWVPHPQWVKVENVTIAEEHLRKAAELLQEELGEDGIRKIGGREWWQWRENKAPMAAEWIEMKSDYNQRKQTNDRGKRVMMYVHGGAYFFGSVGASRYQMQRHARKLNARVFAPKYRLAPQFPFPCGLQDCLAAYLFLLTLHNANEIVLAGDSAGGGMVTSIMCILRDQDIPLPAGAILLSPWVDLTHSFPSVGEPAPFDYIPDHGFHHKPSRSWPPLNEKEQEIVRQEVSNKRGALNIETSTNELGNPEANGNGEQRASAAQNIRDGMSVMIDGELVQIKDQIQMYTTNELLSHSLVSPIMQPTLGGLPPTLVMVGGGEILRDEQIYFAHKLANPTKYAPPPERLNEKDTARLAKYKSTDVQLQVWDDLCHVAPTLSFTRPAKHMYRSVAQFGAWALARAQHRSIEIMDDDAISIISTSDSDEKGDDEKEAEKKHKGDDFREDSWGGEVGKAGDPLPPFKNHMIRQRVTRHGVTHPLTKEDDLPGCRMAPSDVGVISEKQVKKWLTAKMEWETRYASDKIKVHKQKIQELTVGYREFPGECPPPSALASRRKADGKKEKKPKKVKSLGLAVWSLWGSKHDEATVQRERKASLADQRPETILVPPQKIKGQETQSSLDYGSQDNSLSQSSVTEQPRQGQKNTTSGVDDTEVNRLIELRKEREEDREQAGIRSPETGAAGRRPHLGGIAMPFTLNRDAKSASMETLNSTPGEDTLVDKLIAQRVEEERGSDLLGIPCPNTGVAGKRPHLDGVAMPFSLGREAETASMITLESGMKMLPGSRPMSTRGNSKEVVVVEQQSATLPSKEQDLQRPELETFVTAVEDLPKIGS